jgi:hypothetical protein
MSSKLEYLAKYYGVSKKRELKLEEKSQTKRETPVRRRMDADSESEQEIDPVALLKKLGSTVAGLQTLT